MALEIKKRVRQKSTLSSHIIFNAHNTQVTINNIRLKTQFGVKINGHKIGMFKLAEDIIIAIRTIKI